MATPVQMINDAPIEIHGYVSDPKLVGYQILTNYESTYWRALVGNDAWSLYEVLRSFCHEGNNICRPSVNLLIDILGLKQRRVLTGWATKVKGKEYRYPGLIEILQQHQLTTAEVKGEGPEMRYIFHVNKTPGLLSSDQLHQLSKLLQRKHAELIERCQRATQELEAKRRPPKLVKQGEDGGYDKLSEGYDKLPGGYDKLSSEQHPYNTTHRTVTTAKEENNNRSGDSVPGSDVVVALIEKGISKAAAQRLVSRFKHDRIWEKIEFLEFLQETNSEQGKKNPAGWLKRAIEEDYTKPAGFITQTEREAREKARQQAEEEQQRKLDAVTTQETAEHEKRQKIWEEQLTPLKRRYKTSKREEKIWSETLSHFHATNPAKVKLYLEDSVLLSLADSTAVIWLPSSYARQQVEREFGLALKRLLAKRIKEPYEKATLTFVVPERAEEEKEEPSDNPL